MELHGLIFKHGDNDFELCTDFTLTESEKIIIENILTNHINEGFSIRGTIIECMEEIQ